MTAKSVPMPYRQRLGDHLEAAKGFGATQDSEARVKAALRWLANNQSGSGRWEARRLSGGAGLAGDRQDRQAAGAHADTGITGLALLAFLAAGHTHLQGPHQEMVRHGLEFLIGCKTPAAAWERRTTSMSGCIATPWPLAQSAKPMP